MNSLNEQDPEISRAIQNEFTRQQNNINLIASENYVSKAVLDTQGTVLTNKYAEGYPRHRYYGGCEFVDEVESLAIERAKALFKSDHANVQPHSGAQANMAAYFGLINPGDKVMGMRLDHGGHLTHGSHVNFSSKLYEFVAYGVDRELELIDYDEVEDLAKKHRPKLIVAGATAYTRTINFPRLRAIANEIDAKLMVDMAHIAGLVAANEHPSCVPHADVVTSTTHKTLRGPRGGMVLTKQELAKDIDRAVFPNAQGGPLMHIIAAKAVSFGEAMLPEFIGYQKAIKSNAKVMATELKNGGLRLVSGGTDNHMVLVDLTPMGLSGRQAEDILSRVNIVVNRNAIPYDTKPPSVASGIRLGTPAVTSRGFGEPEMVLVSKLILSALANLSDKSVEKTIADEIQALTARFPVPGFN